MWRPGNAGALLCLVFALWCCGARATCPANSTHVFDECCRYDYLCMNCTSSELARGFWVSDGTINTTSCECIPGWQGVDCQQCVQGSNYCSRRGPDAVCDQAMHITHERAYNCTPSSQMKYLQPDAQITIDCKWPDDPSAPPNSGYCTYNAYDSAIGAPRIVSCVLEECTKEITSGNVAQQVNCVSGECECTDLCPSYLKDVINKMSGEMEIVLNLNGNGGHLNNPQYPLVYFEFDQCSGSNCQIPVPLPAVMTLRQKVAIGVGVSCGVLIIIVLLIIVIVSHIRRRQQYIEWGHLRPEVTLTWNGVGCVVQRNASFFNNGEELTILQGISGSARPGRCIALMGESGAGKTTLLDILAGRKSTGDVSGTVLANDQARADDWTRISGYVLQDSALIPTLSVREHLMFVARMRLPMIMSDEQKAERVTTVMRQLRIDHVADVVIGGPLRKGISGGERRRLCVAGELVSDPSVLFLDEPTTGLDSASAASLVSILRELAHTERRTIILSIHQPRSNVYALFDDVVLLAKGQLVYSGPAKAAVDFFTLVGYETPLDYNVADHFIDTMVVADDDEIKRLNRAFVLSSKGSPIPAELLIAPQTDDDFAEDDDGDAISLKRDKHTSSMDDVVVVNSSDDDGHDDADVDIDVHHGDDNDHVVDDIHVYAESSSGVGVADGDAVTRSNRGSIRDSDTTISMDSTTWSHEWEDARTAKTSLLQKAHADVEMRASREMGAHVNSFVLQFVYLCGRMWKNLIRNVTLLPLQYVIHIFVAVIIGVVCYHLSMDISGALNRAGSMFFILSLLVLTTLTSIDAFVEDRLVFMRERASGMYGSAAYFCAKAAVDTIPMRVIPPLIVGLITYPLLGLRAGTDNHIWFLFILVLTCLCANGMCMAVSSIAPSSGVGNLIGVIVVLFWMLFAGLLVDVNNIVAAVRWLYVLSPMHFAFEALMVSQFNGLPINFNPVDFQVQLLVDGRVFVSRLGLNPNNWRIDMSVLSGYALVFSLVPLVLLFALKEKR